MVIEYHGIVFTQIADQTLLLVEIDRYAFEFVVRNPADQLRGVLADRQQAMFLRRYRDAVRWRRLFAAQIPRNLPGI